MARHVPVYRERLASVPIPCGSRRGQLQSGRTGRSYQSSPQRNCATTAKSFRPTELPASHGAGVRGGVHRARPAKRRGPLSLSPFRRCPKRRPLSALPRIQSRSKTKLGHNSRLRYDFGAPVPRPVPADRSKIPWNAEWYAGGPPGIIHRLTVFTPAASQAEWLRGLGKVYLNTFPSNALAIARHVAHNPETKPELLAILTAGEPLTEEIRRQCAEHLDCFCINLFSNAECGVIACDCLQGGVMHVQSELCRVEILNWNDRTRPAGRMGQVDQLPHSIISPCH